MSEDNEIEIDDTVADDASAEEQVFSKEELERIVEKTVNKEKRRIEREFSASQSAPAALDLPPHPHPSQFTDLDKFTDAVAEWKINAREAERHYAEIMKSYVSAEDTARETYDDFEDVAYAKTLTITPTMAQVIQTADNGPVIAYYLGQNPKEATRISKLSPPAQAREIGKIEVLVERTPPKPTSATADYGDDDDDVAASTRRSVPASRSTASTPAKKVYSTTDPRSVDAMSTSEWIKAEQARQIKVLEAKLKGRR